MTSSTGRDVESPPADSPATFDWRAIESSSAFRELVQRKRRFIVPAAIVSGAIFGAYLLLAAFASGLHGHPRRRASRGLAAGGRRRW